MDLKSSYSLEEYANLKAGNQYPYFQANLKSLEDAKFIKYNPDTDKIEVDLRGIALSNLKG